MMGVNPASGMVIYYALNEAAASQAIELIIKDNTGVVVAFFSSEEDDRYVSYEGAPSKKPTLSKNSGLNRFVWNLRHEDLPGIPKVYIEGSFKGHKAIPGNYTISLQQGAEVNTVTTAIHANPMISLTSEEYNTYHKMMTHMETQYRAMTHTTNRLFKAQQQLQQLLKDDRLKQQQTLHNTAVSLHQKLKAWDAKWPNACQKPMTM